MIPSRQMLLQATVIAIAIFGVNVAVAASGRQQLPRKYVVSPSEFAAFIALPSLSADEAAVARQFYDDYALAVVVIERNRESFLAWSSRPLTRDLQLPRYAPVASEDGRRLDAHARRRLIALESDLFHELGLLSPELRDRSSQTLFARRRSRAMPRDVPDLVSIVAELALEDTVARQVAPLLAQYEVEIDRKLVTLEETELSDEWIDRGTLVEERRRSELERVYESAMQAKAIVFRTTQQWIPRIASTMPSEDGSRFRESAENALFSEVRAIDTLTPRLEKALMEVHEPAIIRQLTSLLEEWNVARQAMMVDLCHLYSACSAEDAVHEDALALAAAQINGEQPTRSAARWRLMEALAGFQTVQNSHLTTFDEIVNR